MKTLIVKTIELNADEVPAGGKPAIKSMLAERLWTELFDAFNDGRSYTLKLGEVSQFARVDDNGNPITGPLFYQLEATCGLATPLEAEIGELVHNPLLNTFATEHDDKTSRATYVNREFLQTAGGWERIS